MSIDLTAALAVALVVGVWLLARQRTHGRRGPLPNVVDAPPSAEPIAPLRMNDNGLGTYSLDLPATPDAMASEGRPPD